MTKRVLAPDALRVALQRADLGDAFTATLTPLVGVGNVQVHYEWLYSACNCNGAQGNTFTWSVAKLSDTQVSLSPTIPYRGMKLYASVRPDWEYYVQMQAPHSADWITAVGGDEQIGLQSMDLNVGVFTGLNGQHLMVQPNLSVHKDAFGADQQGYKIQSASGSVDDRTKWFIGIQALTQALDIPTVADLGVDDLETMLRHHGCRAEDENLEHWKSWTGVR